MNLDDFIKHARIPPDDIEDVKNFIMSLCEKVPPSDMTRLMESMFIFVTVMSCMIDEISDLHMDAMERSLGLAGLIKLFQFLKKNEKSVRVMLNIGSAGEPFLDNN